MKKFLMSLLLIGTFVMINNSNVVANATNEPVDELKMLFNEYYNEGVYVKDTVININENVKNELFLFHAKINDLEKTTYYNGPELWFSNGSGYGTSEDNRLTQFKMVNGEKTNIKVVDSLPGMEEYYCTLYDFIVGFHNSEHSNNLKLDLKNGWTVENQVYTSTNPDVLDAFRLFTAPLWLGKTEQNMNYMSYTKATVEVVEKDLVMKLWVSKTEMSIDGIGGKLKANTECDEENAVFSKAVISLPYSVWDGSTVSSALSGKGTEDDPYLIQSAADLMRFKDIAHNMNGKFIKLTTNIDLNNNSLIIPSFNGTFDGNNKTISNLNNNGDSIGWPGDGAGLFKTLEETGTIKNLKLKGYVQSWADTGGIVGHSYGTITNCINYANIDCKWGSGGIAAIAYKGTISNCTNHGNLTSGYENNGGIVGVSYVEITDCTNYGNISSPNEGSNVGGIAGFLQGSIKNCTNYGKITGTSQTGGIVGKLWISETTPAVANNLENNGQVVVSSWGTGGVFGTADNVKITNCRNNGYIDATFTDHAGGIVGMLYAGGDISNCTNNGDIIAYDAIGGIVSYSETDKITNCINNGKITARIVEIEPDKIPLIGDILGYKK